MDGYDPADNSAKCYDVAISHMRDKLASFRKEVIGECTLYLGDCRDVLPLLPRFDAVVTDWPYGIGEAGKNFASRGKPINAAQSGSRAIARATDYGQADWDDEPITAELVSAVRAAAKWQIFFGGNYYELPPTSCWLVWDKLNGDSDFADCELAWTNLPKAVRRIRFLWNGCMRRERDVQREHPTQKPVDVMKWCIEHLPDDTKTILDPFMGSGTTGVASVKAGKKFTGIEREPKYFDIACRRIEEAYKQPDMFVSAPPPKAEQVDMLGLLGMST
jgi:DNA modification methylase